MHSGLEYNLQREEDCKVGEEFECSREEVTHSQSLRYCMHSTCPELLQAKVPPGTGSFQMMKTSAHQA